MVFDNLQPDSEVKIFTLAGKWVRTLRAPAGSVTWDLKNDAGENIASGYYLYLLKDLDGKQLRGKVAVIR
jgi:hypothetical protein